MTKQELELSESEETPQWQKDLEHVGFVRRTFVRRIVHQAWQARKWYGADWWFVVASAVLLFFFVTVAIFPQWFAPYDPREEVGPSLLAPGQPPEGYILVTRIEDGVTELKDVGTSDYTIGFVLGSPASQALRQRITELTSEAIEAGEEVTYSPRPTRFETLEEGMQALAAGEVDGIVEMPSIVKELLSSYEGLEISVTISESGERGFILGTNQIGQDVFSRIIWGTRIALIVGFFSAIVAIVIGVPVGLLSGFIGGPLDRVLTLVMDSMYSFPGLILAIAIAAVLGPGIGNVIVAIAAVYVPTYFRIVRGQTMTVKEQLYVEAARSLGARWTTILTRYVFPNVIPSVVIIFSVNVADAILTEAGLSFIGLGLPPDTPDWGIDLARGQDYLRRAWWLITFPGLMVAMVTLGWSMLGESLSEILNPRLARS
ncbi:MAG: ABC transporter permease subunit [Anaerolineae bacterium]|jgi:peptide/nickel transport system permease protein